MLFRVEHIAHFQVILLHQSDQTVHNSQHIDLILVGVDLRVIHAGRKTPQHIPDLILRPEFDDCRQLRLLLRLKLQPQ